MSILLIFSILLFFMQTIPFNFNDPGFAGVGFFSEAVASHGGVLPLFRLFSRVVSRVVSNAVFDRRRSPIFRLTESLKLPLFVITGVRIR